MIGNDFNTYQRRVGTAVLLGLALVFAVLGGRLVHINTVLASRLQAVLDKQHIGYTPVPGRRGLIFDCQGRVIAGSEQVPGIFADPGRIKDLPKSAAKVAAVLGMIPGEVEDVIRHSETPRFCWLKRRVSRDEADAARSLGLRGFGVQNEPVRRYPLGAALAQVLGFVSPDGKGITGIELQYDSHLCSYNGRITSIGDVGRNAIWRLERGTVPVTDGGHVMLTIDNVIQQLVEEQLEKRVRELKAESGVAVVMSPKTGDILAMACCPTFDPADYGSISQDWWRNRTVTDPVEPGSTFKPVVAGWALAKGFISRTETIFCHNGVYATSGRVLKDVKPHGNLDFAGILVHSSNIGMGIIGQRMGNSVLYEAVRRFGFGQPTGLGFPGESGGIVRALPDWAKLSSTSIPMGYEIGVTPLQLTTAYCAIVNGGILLKPRLVRALLAPEGTPCELSTGPQQIRQVLPEQTARYLAETVLPAVVTRDNSKGTESDYPMLGKTGTAKLLRKDGKRYADRAYLCSFVGAAPVDDPRVVVLVMVRRPDPDLGRFGRIVSMPVVRKIIDLTLSYLDTQSQPEA